MRIILGPLAVLAALAALTGCHELPDGTPIRTAYANDHTTGPEYAGLDEDRLPACAGATAVWTINTTRSIVNCRFVGTTIVVTAPNVRLHNMVILGNSPYIVQHKSTGLVIDNSIIGPRPGAKPIGPQTQPCSASVGDANYTIYRSELFGCADGLKVRRSVAVWSSYFHDLYKGCAGTDCTHNDTVQFQENDTLVSLTFRGNSAYADPCTSNRHFQLKNARNATFDIRNNFFYGMHGILNIDGTASGNRGVVSGNIYAGRSTSGPFTSKGDGSSMSPGLYTGAGMRGITVSSNRFEDGKAAPTSGVAAPYRCVR
jgi:hypothetical protein